MEPLLALLFKLELPKIKPRKVPSRYQNTLPSTIWDLAPDVKNANIFSTACITHNVWTKHWALPAESQSQTMTSSLHSPKEL
ncbi:hypothetical protein E2C01_088681 [Portunus trituberculatus]|uniref:Uncharacterized protein n=1 Tax=Portunus trituberculatus TaxID=210409 RepID=A0A5B7JKH4_PORTR|nr:hypothetical protein [Portunus trituberculatus]